MSRTLLLLVGLGAVVGGTMIWARWWVNSVEPPTAVRGEGAPVLLKRPVDPPRAPVTIRSVEPKMPAAADRGDGRVTVTQMIPLREPAPILTPAPPPPIAPPEASSPEAAVEPSAVKPPEFRHLRRLRDPSNPRARVPPPNNPRIQLEPFIQR